jgi:hypothetical protein
MPDENDQQASGGSEPTEGAIMEFGEEAGSNARADDSPPDTPAQSEESAAGTGGDATGAQSGEEGDEPPQKDGIVMEF